MKRILFGALAAAVFGLGQAPQAEAQEKVRVTQAVASFAFLPIDYAKASGIFEEEGLDVQQIATRGGGPDLTALISGDVQFNAAAGTYQIGAISAGRDIVNVYNFYDRNLIGLVLSEKAATAAGVAPDAPLALIYGTPGQGLSVSFHRAFLSNALYPLGPRGYPEAEARGEGSAAFFFTQDSCAFALRLHTEYLDDLGTNADHLGEVSLTFYGRDGQELGRITRAVPGGISSHGFQTDDGMARIAGVLVENLDPGGIALDDIRFGCIARLG